MLNQKMQSGHMAGLRYRGISTDMPPVSRFRSGYMPSGMNLGRVTDNISESDMDTSSDSDGEGYGARYSLEASPQDDKLPNGSRRNSGVLNGRSGNSNGLGNSFGRQRRRGGGTASSVHRGSSNEELSESVSSSEMSSTPPRSTNGFVLEKKFKLAESFSGISLQSDKESVKQDSLNTRLQSNLDEDIPSAPPLAGSFQHANRASEKFPHSRADSKSASASSGVSTSYTEPNMYNGRGPAQAKTPVEPTRAAPAAASLPLPARYPTFHARQSS